MRNIMIELDPEELKNAPFLEAVVDRPVSEALAMLADPAADLGHQSWGQGLVSAFATLAAHAKGENPDQSFPPQERYYPHKINWRFREVDEDIRGLLLAMMADPRVEIGDESYEHGTPFLSVMRWHKSPYYEDVLTGLVFRAGAVAAPLMSKMKRVAQEVADAVRAMPKGKEERSLLAGHRASLRKALFGYDGFSPFNEGPYPVQFGGRDSYDYGALWRETNGAVAYLKNRRREIFDLVADKLPGAMDSFLEKAVQGPLEGTPYAIIRPDVFRQAAEIGDEDNDKRLQGRAAYFLCETALGHALGRFELSCSNDPQAFRQGESPTIVHAVRNDIVHRLNHFLERKLAGSKYGFSSAPV